MKKNNRFIVLPILILIILTSTWRADAINKIVSFGDSLTDNGNVVSENAPFYPFSEKYYKGRFSNGPVWVEYLAGKNLLDVPLEDYAIGGAQSEGHIPPGLQDQVFGVTNLTDEPSSETLFTIWIGGNDYLDGSGDANETVGNIKDAMTSLIDYGAVRFLVFNLPDLGKTPRFTGTDEAALATAFSDSFNAELSTMLNDLSGAHPDILIYPMDVHAFLSDVLKNPSIYGFTNVTESSPNFDIDNNFNNDAGYLFWDDIHPTTEAHELIATRVYDILKAHNEIPHDANTKSSSGSSGGSSGGCFINTLK